MVNLLLTLILFTKLTTAIITENLSDKILSLQTLESIGSYDLYIRIGDLSKWKIVELNMQIPFMYLSVHNLQTQDPTINIIQSGIPITVRNENFESQLVTAKITFKTTNTEIYSFPLYYKGKNYSEEFDSFPLAKSFHNETFSLIHQLKQLNIIDKACFMHEYNLEKGNGYLHLGGVPFYIQNNYTNSLYLKQDKYNNKLTWGGDIQSVVFRKKRFMINNYAYFTFNENNIYVNKTIMEEVFIKGIFKEYIDKMICSVLGNSLYRFIQCKSEDIKKMPIIEIIIDDIRFSFQMNELFDDSNLNVQNRNFMIVDNARHQDIIVLGNVFLWKYIALFDYDKNMIVFLNNKIENDNGSKNGVIKAVFQINIIMLIGAYFMLRWKMKLKDF